MSMKTESRHEVVVPPRTGRRAASAVVGGLLGTALGLLLGFLIGANIGGQWFTSFSFAGQRGYEATSLVGAAVGAVVFGALGVGYARRRRAR